MPVPASAQVRTANPDGTDRRWLGQSGHVVSLKYSYAMPGGPDQMSCVLQTTATSQDPAIRVGRQVEVFAGGLIWSGQLDEPTPGQDGWQVIAHGCGTFGGQYLADYTGHTWGAHSPDDVVTNAIGNGLRWVNGGLYPLPDGAWLGQAPDNGTQTVADILSLVCSRGGLTWQVTTGPGGNQVDIIPLPTEVTRLLVAVGPVARTLAGVVNAVCLRYCSKADDAAGTSTYSTVWATSPALIAKYGRTERSVDLSNAGVMPGTGANSAQAVGQQILKRYQQAAFGGPFTVTPGQYLTATGTPVALGTERAGEVVRLLMCDYGGAVATGTPVEFVVGGYEYDEESRTATVTPFGSVLTDWSALVSSMTEFSSGKDDPFGVKAGGA